MLAGWLALLLVLAPTLERMHGVHHPTPAASAGAGLASTSTGISTGLLAALFDDHSALDCWALEQLGHGHDGSAEQTPSATLCPQAAPAWQPCPAPARPALRLFEARAPPASCMV
ncbi:MAG: hypothetical protein KIG95_14765 [Comamonas sp.]|nr:hypothetical protein [Comamonas sp.]